MSDKELQEQFEGLLKQVELQLGATIEIGKTDINVVASPKQIKITFKVDNND